MEAGRQKYTAESTVLYSIQWKIGLLKVQS